MGVIQSLIDTWWYFTWWIRAFLDQKTRQNIPKPCERLRDTNVPKKHESFNEARTCPYFLL